MEWRCVSLAIITSLVLKGAGKTGGKKHLLQVALRLEHVPFPIVVEESPKNRNRRLELQRRQAIVDHLTRLGLDLVDSRVVVAPAISEGITAIEGEANYYQVISGNVYEGGYGAGGAYGGFGGFGGGTYR